MFQHELALELGKTIREMTSGVPGMSAHELLVEWPAYFRARNKLAEWEEKLKDTTSPEQFDQEFARTMGGGG